MVTKPVAGQDPWDVALNSALDELQADADAAQATANSAASTATGAASGVSTLNGTVSTLQTAMTTAQGDITALEGQVAGGQYFTLVAANAASAAIKAKADQVCDGTADQVQIQAAVDAAFAAGGGTVQLSAGVFFMSAPITLHPMVQLRGMHGDQIFNPDQFTAASYLRPVSGFTGGAVVVLLDQTNGSYASKSAEQQILSLTIDGTGVGGTVHGIQAGGYIHGVLLRDVAVKNVTGKGIYTFTENGSQPFSWNLHRVVVDNPDGVGIHLINHSDCTMTDVVSIGAGDNAFTLSNMPNSRMLGVRAEWSEGHGYYITGNWGTGQGSGGMSMVGCSSDRNRHNGVLVDATGNGPLLFSGITCRRDGRNGGSGGGDYSGFRVTSATMPVIVDNLVTYPGVDDGGSGTNSPVNAFKASGSTYVALSSGMLHGATNGFVDGGTNSVLRRGPNIGERTGTTGAPTDAFGGQWTAAGIAFLPNATAPGSNPAGGSLLYAEGGFIKARSSSGDVVNLQDLATLDFQPRDHGAVAWTQDPATATGGATSTGGTVYLMRIAVRQAMTITAIGLVVTTAGATLTTNQNFVGLYNSAGTLLATSADQTTAWGTIGYKSAAISQAVTPGYYYVGIVSNGTTPASFLRGNSQSSSALNFNLASGSGRFLSVAGPNTSLPASVTFGSAATDNNARWAALL